MRSRLSRLVLLPTVGLLASLASLHCGSAAEPLNTPGTPPSATPNDAGGTGREGGGSGDEREVPLDASTTPIPRGIEVNRLVLVNGSKLPAFRICPANAGTGATSFSTSSARPSPEVAMPQSSLEGVSERGAVGLLPLGSEFQGPSVVVLWIDEVTKNHPGLATGSCAGLACIGGSGCFDDGGGAEPRVTVVPVEDSAFDKAGIVVLTGNTRATARFVARSPRQSSNATPGAVDVQLFNESTFGGEVSFEDVGKPSTPVGGTPLSYSSFGAAFVAGTHRATLLDVHTNSDPRRPVADFYANPGLFALFLFGTPEDLKFVAVPTHQ